MRFSLNDEVAVTMSGRSIGANRLREIGGRHHAADEWSEDGRQAAILPTSGVAANGKPIYDWDQAAAQLTRSGNTWSAALGEPVTITYAFRATAPSTLPGGIGGFQQFNSAQIVAAEAALQLWADVANIVFVRVGFGVSGPGAYSNSATILFANYTTESDPAAAFAYLPVPGATSSASAAGDVWVDVSEPENANPVFGGYGPHVLAHEIGHAIGLNHPGDYDGGSPTYAADAVYWQDARMFTIMSYFGSTNTGGNLPTFAWGPQYHDIAAAQRLYGPNLTTRTGDTIYGFNSNAGRSFFDIASASQGVTFSIWDAGGDDTLDLSGYFENADIDLRPGAFSSAGPTLDAGPARYNLSIAIGVVIENAAGGHGDDLLTGNEAANALRGGPGADALHGEAGRDTLFGGDGGDDLNGGAGYDVASFAASTAAIAIVLSNPALNAGEAAGDTIRADVEAVEGSAFDDLLQGNASNNVLIGGAGADTLAGGYGDDVLEGGPAADSISGGEGFDIATYASAASGVHVALWSPASNTGEAAGDIIHYSVEVLEGSAFVDNLQGNSSANNLRGAGGDDLILGGFGDDTLTGGAGGDDLGGGEGFDVASYQGAAGGVRIALWNPSLNTGDAVNDTIRADVEVVEGTAFNDTLEGSAAPNNLRGAGGDDRLYGGGGGDTLWGQAGNDTLTGGDGFDRFVFETGGGADIVVDAVGGPGASDLILFIGFGPTYDTFGEAILAASEVGADVVFDFGGGQSLTLLNATLAALDPDDFAFA